jgi:hypothetical protein
MLFPLRPTARTTSLALVNFLHSSVSSTTFSVAAAAIDGRS